MRSIRDGRRFIKYLDWEYHKKFPVCDKLLEKPEFLGNTVIYILRESGSHKEWCGRYLKSKSRSIVVKPGLAKFDDGEIEEILSMFECSWEITEEEWAFFCTVMPDKRSKIGLLTQYFCHMELFLSGNSEYRIESFACLAAED